MSWKISPVSINPEAAKSHTDGTLTPEAIINAIVAPLPSQNHWMVDFFHEFIDICYLIGDGIANGDNIESAW